MTSRYYAWKDGEVIKADRGIDTDGLFCVDDSYPTEKPKWRYGTYNTTGVPAWTHIPLSDFPPEFRTHLLLLGVS